MPATAEARSFAITRRHVFRAGRLEEFFDSLVDAAGHRGIRKPTEQRIRILARQRRDGGQLARERVCQRVTIAADKHGRCVDATASTVRRDRLHDHIEMLFPIVRAVVADEHFAPAGSVNLNVSEGRVFF